MIRKLSMIPLYIPNLKVMSDSDIKQMQEKIDEAIRKAQEKLVEKIKREDGQLVVTRDGQVRTLRAAEI